MKDGLRKVSQVVGAWLIVLVVLWLLWPPIIYISQIWVLIAVSTAANLLQPGYKLSEGSRTSMDRGTARQIVWTVYGSQVLAVLELCIQRLVAIEWNIISYSALFLMVSGLFLRTWAVFTLKNFFTWNIDVQRDQHVITNGPYRLMRHPSYTGAWLTYVGSCILLRSWTAAFISAVALAVAFLRRVRYEEEALNTNVPGYREYAARTKRFVPWVF